jgi:ectoine hydroxylase-related dioxygenase (phytanoyl-CoA dioxygenase family)
MSDVIAGHDVGAILAELDVNGYCVVPDVLDADQLAEVSDAIERATREDDLAGRSSLYGPGDCNRRIWALLNRGEEFIRLGTHPLATAILDDQLGEDWLLTNLTVNICAPGGDSGIGRLHTDQSFVPLPWPPFPLAMNIFWMIDDFTEENGATIVAPGSHKSGRDASYEAEPDTGFQAVGTAGSMGILDGRIHHATGLNRTTDSRRRGVFGTYSPPFIRSQENWSRSLEPEVLERHPELARRIGLEVWRTLGLINGSDVAFNA